MKKYEDYASDIFACVLQHGPENINIVFELVHADAEQLFSGIWGDLYHIILNFFRLTGKVIGQEEFVDFINSSSMGSDDKSKRYIVLFDKLINSPVKAGIFKFYLQQLIEFVMREKSRKMLVNAHEALTNEFVTKRKKSYKGYPGMRKLLFECIHDLDRLIAENSPEGSVNYETDEILDEYKNLKENDNYVLTGFKDIDKCTGGLYPGELWLWVGYAAEGKTFSCINIGYHVAYNQKKNVLFLTNETVRSVVRRRLISRHARQLTGAGIDLTDWKKGELNEGYYEKLQNTLKDMEERKNEYGIFHILQLPANADTDFVAAALTRCQALFNVDLCILDSIHLLKPKKSRQSEYSELGDMLIDIKKIILSHNNGRGVPLISPWHTNRSSWETAKEKGVYTKSSLAKSGEAERSADVIVTILLEDFSDIQLRCSIIKSRDGEELKEFYLNYNFNQGYIGDQIVVPEDTIDLMAGLGL
jgi:replicative DNA helicase